MKTILTILLTSLVIAPNTLNGEDLGDLLRKGLFEEEANQNLNAAVKNYEAVVSALDHQRTLAALAIFRLGECYRKLTQTNEAIRNYERIVQEFSDQTNLTQLSKKALATFQVLSKGPSPTSQGKAQQFAIFPNQPTEAEEIQNLQELFRDSPDIINDTRAGPARFAPRRNPPSCRCAGNAGGAPARRTAPAPCAAPCRARRGRIP